MAIPGLRHYTKQVWDELILRLNISFFDSLNLPLSNHGPAGAFEQKPPIMKSKAACL